MTYELGGILGAMIAIILGAIGYGRLQNQVENVKTVIPEPQQTENENIWREVGKRRTEHEEYVKIATERRIEFERELSRIRESSSNRDAKLTAVLDAILDRLKTMDVKIDRLEARETPK